MLSGGRTEVIEKYFEVIQDFLDRGFVVLAHDWRGQGLSHRALGDPLKGHADGSKAFLDDFRILLDAYASRLPKPWVAVAHSILVILYYLLKRPETTFRELGPLYLEQLDEKHVTRHRVRRLERLGHKVILEQLVPAASGEAVGARSP